MTRILLTCGICLGTSCGVHGPSGNLKPPQEELEVVNLLPSFWRYWESAKQQPLAIQRQLFKQQIVSKYPALFTPNVLDLDPKLSPGDALDKVLTLHLRRLPAHIPAMRRLSTVIRTQLAHYLKRFRGTYPDFRYRGKVYFTLSLGAFDGATRTVGSEEPLLFGVDGMAMYHPAGASPAAFFHHELFHLYHRQHLPQRNKSGREPLYLSLWREGLAVHVSKALNPHASNQELTLVGLPARVDPALPRLAATLRDRLDSTSEEDYRSFFMNSRNPRIPSRSGYYIGKLVADRLAGMGLQQLARRQSDLLRNEVKAALEALAAAPIRPAPDLEVRRLGPGVWLHVSWFKLQRWGRVSSNGLIVTTADGVALLDTPWTDQQTGLLLRWILANLGPVRLAVVTHAHEDRMGGIRTLHQRGITIHALERTAQLLRQKGYTMPFKTFRAPTHRVSGLEFHFAGAGHTEDNIVVWLPAARILHGACHIKSLAARDLGNVKHADLARWSGSIKQLISRYPSVHQVIPGHGAVGTSSLLQHTLRLLRQQTHK